MAKRPWKMRSRCVLAVVPHFRFSILLSPLLVLLPLAAGASQFVSAANVECADGQVTLARHWEPLVQQGFEREFSGWQVDNYEEALKPQLSTDGPHSGAHCFLLTNAKAGDTAWELTSPAIKAPAAGSYELRFWVRTNRSLGMVAGHQGHYQSALEWHDAAGGTVGRAAIPWGDADERWHELTLAGEIPAGAATAVIRFGFDQPNLGPGEYLALDDISLLTRTAASGYEPAGEFISRPLRLKGPGPLAVRWEARAPQATVLSLQVRFAADELGGPGAWGAFAGPDGPDSFFTRPGETVPEPAAWAQYRVRLETQDPRATPALRSVTLGEVTDGPYEGLDLLPPALVSYGPTRYADPLKPFEFTLRDDGVGYDERSVRLWVDEAPVRVERAAPGRYRWQPPAPLAPPSTLTSLRSWQVRNFSSALQIKADAPRTPGGADSVLVTRPAGETDTAFSLVSPDIPVTAGAKYTLRFWLRGDVELAAADDRGGGVQWLGAEGKLLGEKARLTYGKRSEQWQEVRQEFTAPVGAEAVVISLGWDTPNIADRRFVQFADPQWEGPQPRRSLGPNLHQVRLAARDFAGHELTRECYLLVKPAPVTGKVTIRDDGVTLIDGVPFFPIGIYSISKRPANNNSYDTAFAELKSAGFNLAHTYASARNADFAEFYAAAARHGMKLWVSPEAGNNSPDAWGAVRTVARECNESALLAWYLADDTASWISADDLKRVHRAVMDVDPYHMTTQADGCSALGDERYLRYVDSTTGFLPELYPIHELTGNHVADVIRGMKNVQAAWKAAGRVTPTWAIIQDFEGWGWKRFPTDAEERCMVYLALIHGAQGMTWYTYSYRDDKHGAPWDPQKWAYLKGIATELSSLSPVLTSRDPQEQPRGEIVKGPQKGDLDYPSLNLRLKRWDGSWYLLAANSAEQPITAKLTLPGLQGEAEVLFEGGRKVTATGGALQDEFAPLAVHVYRWR